MFSNKNHMIGSHDGLRTHLGDGCNSYISNLINIVKICMTKHLNSSIEREWNASVGRLVTVWISESPKAMRLQTWSVYLCFLYNTVT